MQADLPLGYGHASVCSHMHVCSCCVDVCVCIFLLLEERRAVGKQTKGKDESKREKDRKSLQMQWNYDALDAVKRIFKT